MPLPWVHEWELLQQVRAGKQLTQSLPLPQSPPPHSSLVQKQPAQLPQISLPSLSNSCVWEQKRQLLQQAQVPLPHVLA